MSKELKELVDSENVDEDLNTLSKDSILKETVDEDDKPIKKRKMSKPKTEAQLEALAKGREKLIKQGVETKQRKEEEKLKRQEEIELKRLEIEEREKEKTEKLIVQKALAIKKREIKKQSILNEIEDDNTPVHEIKTIAKKIPKKEIETPKSQFTFLKIR